MWRIIPCCNVILLFLLFAVPNSFASMAYEWKLPAPIRTSIRFLPGHSPDKQGKFEIEVYCTTRFDIDLVEIVIGHSKEITFDKDLPSYYGMMKAGQAKLWKIKGVVNEKVISGSTMLPSSITFGVRYLSPYEAGLKYIEEHFGKKNEALLGGGEVLIYPKGRTGLQTENRSVENSEYMMILKKQEGRTLSIIKPLAVVRQK